MSSKSLTLSQYIVSFSSDKDYSETNQLVRNMFSELSLEKTPEGVNPDVFESFFRKVIHEETDYVLHFNDAILDICLFDHDDDSENDNQYVLGFLFEGSSGWSENEMIQVFSEVVIPLLQQYFPKSVIERKIQTHFEYSSIEEGCISF